MILLVAVLIIIVIVATIIVILKMFYAPLSAVSLGFDVIILFQTQAALSRRVSLKPSRTFSLASNNIRIRSSAALYGLSWKYMNFFRE